MFARQKEENRMKNEKPGRRQETRVAKKHQIQGKPDPAEKGFQNTGKLLQKGR